MDGLSCPFCPSADVERVGLWGGQIITSQWRCRACGSYFEALRDEFAGGGPSAGEPAFPHAASPSASIDPK